MLTLLVSLIALSGVDTLSYNLMPRRQECFGLKVLYSGSTIIGGYEVSGVSAGIGSAVLDPNGVKVWSSSEVAAKFELPATALGNYKMCFDSSVSSVQVLSFDIHVSSDRDFYDTKNMATKSHADKVTDTVEKISWRIKDVQRQQQHGITREHIHSDLAELTNSKVVFWSVIQISVLTIASVIQICYLKSFFEVKQLI